MALTLDQKVKFLDVICNELVSDPKLQPVWKDGVFEKSFCNQALDKAALKFGYNQFHTKEDYLSARECIQLMEQGKCWKQVSPEDAWEHAMRGGLAVATFVESPHSHVAVVAPKPKIWSQKWVAYWPQVANVGKNNDGPDHKNVIEGENFAFNYRPVHYVYLP